MKRRFDITLIICFLLSIWCGFVLGCLFGARATKYNIEKKAVKEKRGVIKDGKFEWLIKGEEK